MNKEERRNMIAAYFFSSHLTEEEKADRAAQYLAFKARLLEELTISGYAREEAVQAKLEEKPEPPINPRYWER